MLALDFDKAYNTITFEHAHVMFHLMGLPTGMIAVMMQLLQSLVSFCIQGIVIPDVVWTPPSRNHARGHIFTSAFCTLRFCDYPHFTDNTSKFMRAHVCR